MFDIGWSELLLIGVLCLFVFGPEDIPKIMYNFGRIVRRFRYLRYALSSQFEDFMEKAESSARKSGTAPRVQPIEGGIPRMQPAPEDIAPPEHGTQESEEADTDDYLMELRPPPEHVPERPVILDEEPAHEPARPANPAG